MRIVAREKAFQLIYERLFVKNSYGFDEEFFSSIEKEEDIQFAKDLVYQFQENRETLSTLISSHLVGYEIDRLYKVDLALLYLALTEIIYIQTPVQVAVNEAVTLAKRYSEAKSSRFINGVLSSILKDINKKQ